MTSHTLPDISDSAPRVATSADAAIITGVLTDAFGSDPIWGTWAFPGHHAPSELRRAVFRILIEGALRFAWVWLTPGDTATSVWFPPGESELTPRQEAALDALLRDSLGTGAGRILRSFEQFETARPQAQHYYLSLLGTDPRHAAHGYGRSCSAPICGCSTATAPRPTSRRTTRSCLCTNATAFGSPDGSSCPTDRASTRCGDRQRRRNTSRSGDLHRSSERQGAGGSGRNTTKAGEHLAEAGQLQRGY